MCAYENSSYELRTTTHLFLCSSMSPKVNKPATEQVPVRTSTQFTDMEISELLNIISTRKLVGNEMWKEVESEWNARPCKRRREGGKGREGRSGREGGKGCHLLDVNRHTGVNG